MKAARRRADTAVATIRLARGIPARQRAARPVRRDDVPLGEASEAYTCGSGRRVQCAETPPRSCIRQHAADPRGTKSDNDAAGCATPPPASGERRRRAQSERSVMSELLFIRHGETDWNRLRRFQGQIDVPLNVAGQRQAERLAARLADDPYDELLSSDLLRARQTAAPLAAAWHREPTPVAGLREQNFGILDGLDAPTIMLRHPELWARWIAHEGDFEPPGGESLAQFHHRVLDTVRALADVRPGARLALITHGGVLDMLWRTALGLPIAGMRTCEIPNTGLNRLRWSAGTLVIERWADAGHLEGLPAPIPSGPGRR